MSVFNETLSAAVAMQGHQQEIFRATSVPRVASGAYKSVKEILFRRVSYSPFITETYWPLHPSWNMDIDLSDDEYYDKFYEIITEFPGGYRPYPFSPGGNEAMVSSFFFAVCRLM